MTPRSVRFLVEFYRILSRSDEPGVKAGLPAWNRITPNFYSGERGPEAPPTDHRLGSRKIEIIYVAR